MKILTIIGARPQFIKAAIISQLLLNIKKIDEIILHTGQHYDDNMSAIFFNQLDLPKPKYNLAVGSGLQGEQTAKMLDGIEKIIIQEMPKLVLVYGDTNSTLASALAASKLHIPVAHVEAGLRSFNKKMPEEINRILTDHTSDYLFSTSQVATQNLIREGISSEKIFEVGDIMYDATLFFDQLAEKVSLKNKLLKTTQNKYILATIHRAENTDNIDILKNIMRLLEELSKEQKVIFPIHPRTKNILEKFKIFKTIEQNNNLLITQPLDYFSMLFLEKNSYYIVTDSGGVQKEAFYNRKPCVILRTETEWTELVETGWGLLLPPAENFQALTKKINLFKKNFSPKYDIELYGGGKAAQAIIDCLNRVH